MAGHRPADWHVLDLDKGPTPGDPQRVRTLAKLGNWVLSGASGRREMSLEEVLSFTESSLR